LEPILFSRTSKRQAILGAMTKHALLVAVMIAFVSCGAPGVVGDAGQPPATDAGTLPEVDAGTPGADAGLPDAGDLDAGAPPDDDAGVAAGDLDAGDVDAGAVDAGAVDAGAVDAGAVDAGLADAGLLDAGPRPLELTGSTGQSQPVAFEQPSLAVHAYVVHGEGFFPSTVDPTMGNMEGSVHFMAVELQGGNLEAQGQLISLVQDQAFFNILDNAFGGDGVQNFAVPDLSDRLVLGAQPSGSPALGQVSGTDTFTLKPELLAAHLHTVPIAPFVTSTSDGGVPFEARSPALAIHMLISTVGPTPSPTSSVTIPFVGQIIPFASRLLPAGWLRLDGSTVPKTDSPALAGLLGTRFGGSTTTFALPDLRDRVALGSGTGIGLAPVAFAQPGGAPTLQMSAGSLAPHAHPLPDGGTTGLTGDGGVLSTQGPGLGLSWLIATAGVFPTPNTPVFSKNASTAVGELLLFAGDFAPKGFVLADGRLLQISSNLALFALLGATYGGDGTSTFAVPDLRGRTVVGVSPSRSLGQLRGANGVTLTVPQLPAHAHTF
jgi:microcystin-dependent protein